MTRRPRAHQLETESRRAFSASLPPAWVFRDLTPDYGLDGVVEIFDDRGQATGHLFFVQIKATDTIRRDAALRVRLTKRILDYYSTLVLPVLVVIFQAPTSGLYARWVTSESILSSHRRSKSIAIRLSEEDEWSPIRLPVIIQELEDLRAAMIRGHRELRIQRYYDQRRSNDPAAKPTGRSHPIQRFHRGDRVLHGVFGLGTVDQESENCLFVHFDEDRISRKFLPGDTWEFTQFVTLGGD